MARRSGKRFGLPILVSAVVVVVLILLGGMLFNASFVGLNNSSVVDTPLAGAYDIMHTSVTLNNTLLNGLILAGGLAAVVGGIWLLASGKIFGGRRRRR